MIRPTGDKKAKYICTHNAGEAPPSTKLEKERPLGQVVGTTLVSPFGLWQQACASLGRPPLSVHKRKSKVKADKQTTGGGVGGGSGWVPGCPGTGPWAAGEKGHLGAMLAYMQAAVLRRCVAAPCVARAWLRAESPAYREAEGYRSEKCTKSRAGSTFPTSILPTPRP